MIGSNLLTAAFRIVTAAAVAIVLAGPAAAQQSNQYSMQEIIDAGHGFFGEASGGLAKVVERAFESYGLPNGYILGQEGSGAFVAGLTYGEGTLNTKNAGQHPVFWQGPSLGLDWGGQGSRTMMLVYNLPDVNALYDRFGGVSGSAYVIAGVGMQVNVNRDIVLVPIRTGVGARIGINAGYLKLTRQPTWNPF
ncbi:EipA family protein [Shinella sp. H4-D48]|uniref:EipA family protein n=1 Tax=Shinella sedimenti TaxID=2919913 RepID=A0ABT0CPR5_9HYPH|nr:MULTISPECIES: EipA family protein [Shinella]MCJ8150607.1 EipA family protein [Shinella sedimenti]UNK38830.1 EipA family protein [Shinella sp. H4-D48]